MKKHLLLLIALAGCSSDAKDTVADPALHIIELTEAGGSGQVADAGEPTTRPLGARVRVDGMPHAGITVYWTAAAGEISDSSVTNAAGIASATWRLGTRSGEQHAEASIRPRPGVETRVSFTATARSGRAASMTAMSGDQQSQPVNTPGGRTFAPITVRVADRFGNPTIRATVKWTVESGPLYFVDNGVVLPPDENGVITRRLGSAPVIGTSTIRATLEETGQTITFTEHVSAAEYWAVLMYDYESDEYEYRSPFNFRFYDEHGLFPATHTLDAGSVFRWENRTGQAIRVTLTPGDASQNAIEIAPGTSSATVLNVPGTYTYTAAGYPRATGTIIVK